MSALSNLSLPATFVRSTATRSFQVERSTFGILTVPLSQIEGGLQVDLTIQSGTDSPVVDSHELRLSSEAAALLQQGLDDAAEGRTTLVPADVFRLASE